MKAMFPTLYYFTIGISTISIESTIAISIQNRSIYDIYRYQFNLLIDLNLSNVDYSIENGQFIAKIG